MLMALDKIRWLKERLDEIKNSGEIKDFRIKLHSNSKISVFVLYENHKPSLTGLVEENEKITFEWITPDELKEDSFYESLFTQKEPVDLGSRRRFANLIDIEAKEEINSCPIINFYSYKGGVGRSTTLALFASYYAIKGGKKVVIIDCDFEAPGFINFYGLDYEETGKNGIVELVLNTQFSDEKVDLRHAYTIEVSKEYSGNGSIFIMPAGNLSTPVDLTDYLEALARIDINSTTTIKRQFKQVIETINEEFKPDIILIDNRTGFNDVFGVMGYVFSSIVVGFFGNNRQTKPGLHFFLDTIYRIKGDTGFILVNSILPNRPSARVKDFGMEIENYLKQTLGREDGDIPTFYTYGISRNLSLEDIGSPGEDLTVFKEFVKDDISRNLDYLELFEKMTELIDEYESMRNRKEHPPIPSHYKKETEAIRKEVLETLYENFPEPYAETIEFTDQFLNSGFYFRKCMEDIFNFDKFLLLGGKGTGKTAFYRAMQNGLFFDKLLDRARKKDLSFINVNAVTAPGEEKGNKYLEMVLCSGETSGIDPALFYLRFWVIYTWNAVMSDSQKTGFTSKLEVKEIKNDTATAQRFLTIINDTQKYTRVEEEMKDLDSYLKAEKKYLIITYDQLDFVVKPGDWSKGIAPLVNYWRNNPFGRISGKLFLRRDLFDKMGNLTNKEFLRNQAINLEWSQEEMFAFFFKLIFYYSGDPFFELMKRYGDIPEKSMKNIRTIIEKPLYLYQLPLDENFLKPVVETFFGKFTHPDLLRYGESYTWFYRNLKNADNTISLRPFIDLIKYAVERALKPDFYKYNDKPVLPGIYYSAAAVRQNAVKRHFEDLASEAGNEDLKSVIEYIRDKEIPVGLRRTNLNRDQFEKLLKFLIEKDPRIKNKDIDKLTEMLISSGIISERFASGGRKKYSFAFLYKYFLGLKG